MNEFKVQNKFVGVNRPSYFIADIAANHDGDLERAKMLIHKAAKSGADAVKFQHFKAKTIVSDFGFKNLGDQQSHQASWKKSVFEVYEEASLNLDWTPILKEESEKAGIHFFTSPYSLDLVDEVDAYVVAYKVGSGDITWPEIIEKMAKKNKPMFIACGASTIEDVIRAANISLKFNPNLCIMQCNTNYTASMENFKYINLNVLNTFKGLFPNILLGLSDHTPGHATVLGAIALGARAIEKHFTDDNNREGPDHKFSMNPVAWKEMIDRSRELEASLGNGIKKIEDNEKETVILQRRSVRLNKNLKRGHSITLNDLECLRPCPKDAISPDKIEDIIGLKINRDMVNGEHLRWKDLSDL